MSEILSHNQQNDLATNQTKVGLREGLDQQFLEKNAWKKLNGGCPISSDIQATLDLLKENVHPKAEDLAELVKLAVAKYALAGQNIEQVWAEKIAEGANFVGVVDGVFGFYRGEEKLATANKPLLIAALPASLEFREQNKQAIHQKAVLARQDLRASLRSRSASGVGELGVSAAQV